MPRDQQTSGAGRDTAAASTIRSAADESFVDKDKRQASRANLFTILTILWLFPTAGAATIIALNSHRWREAGSLKGALQAVGFEQWIAFGLIATHLVFGWLAWKLRRRQSIEKRRESPVRGSETPY